MSRFREQWTSALRRGQKNHLCSCVTFCLMQVRLNMNTGLNMRSHTSGFHSLLTVGLHICSEMHGGTYSPSIDCYVPTYPCSWSTCVISNFIGWETICSLPSPSPSFSIYTNLYMMGKLMKPYMIQELVMREFYYLKKLQSSKNCSNI